MTIQSASVPRISIVTVAYNAEQVLEPTLQSVLALTYPNVEFIVIDGASKDRSLEIINKYRQGIAYFVSEPDKGIYDAMNKGIAAATGDWINFMNCGDRFARPDALNFFEEAQDADIVYGNAIIEYPGFATPWVNFPPDTLWKHMIFCHQAAFTKTSLMKSEPFDLQYRVSSDFDFIYKAYQAGRTFQHVDRLICYFDFKGGASLRNQVLSLQERQKAVLSHQFTVGKWIYFTGQLWYVRLTSTLKRMIGQNATGWITKLLRK